MAGRWAILLVPIVAALGCSGGRTAAPSTPTEQPAPPPVPTGPNTLTDAERAAGWRLLFDGRTTTGWRGFRQSGVPAGWQAIDEALTRVSSAGDLITADEFASFELAIEWQVGEGGNSGIMYRVSETVEPTFFSGPEFQIIDNARNPGGGTDVTSAAACYALYAPSTDVMRPAGSWNQARILVDGAHVEHWLNGVHVVTYELGSADWLERVQRSMFRDVATYGRQPRGHLALQDHGDRVSYRAIKIRVLP
jgi:Domain of Unknown Function (DUF1080)